MQYFDHRVICQDETTVYGIAMKKTAISFLRKPKHWIVLLLAVIVLHLLAIEWVAGRLGAGVIRQSEQVDSDNPVSVSLQPALVPDATSLKPGAQPKQDAEQLPATEAQDASSPETSVPTPADAESASPSSDTQAKAVDVKTATPAEKPVDANSGTAARNEWHVSAPPSVLLSYRIQAQRKGQSIYGRGHIRWQNDKLAYTLEGESSLLLVSVFNFRSEGTIDSKHGISPVLYSEKRFRKPETNTHFHRERNLLSFSASTRTYPRVGGEQDRSSVAWQLAGIGREGSEPFKAGVQFPLFVAGTRDANVWTFNVLGLEEIDTVVGKLKAWHLVRKPRADSYEQSIDIWLAPEKEWYPVKLRYTDKNGDNLDMTVSEIKSEAR